MTTPQRIIKTKRMKANDMTFKNREEVVQLVQWIMERELLDRSLRDMAADYGITAPTMSKRYYDLIKKL